MNRTKEVEHPYIHRAKGVCGGEPVIRGTRFTVRAVAEYVLLQGMAPEEVVREWTHLKLAQVYDALSYYHDHQTEMERLMRANRERVVRKKVRLHNYKAR